MLADGVVIEGFGVGAVGAAAGEVCFNTAMTGYEEILTDPSYAAQIVTFTFPHIGIVGVNDEDIEVVNAAGSAAIGAVMRADVSAPSNFRSHARLDGWLKARGIIGVTGIDTRALTTLIRRHGMPNAVIAHAPDGAFDLDALRAEAARWPGIDGMDLVPAVGSTQRYDLGRDQLEPGNGLWPAAGDALSRGRDRLRDQAQHPPAAQRLRLRGDRGSGDRERRGHPGAQARRRGAQPMGRATRRPPANTRCRRSRRCWRPRRRCSASVSAISCWGSRSARRTVKMPQGHHGANHPVKDFTTGKVEIVSMNHGFAVDRATLPANAEETHVSLFDGSNCGIALADRPAFSVQYHPEASPGPRDSHYLFRRFVDLIAASKGAGAPRAA